LPKQIVGPVLREACFRIKRNPAQLLGNAVARLTPPLDRFSISQRQMLRTIFITFALLASTALTRAQNETLTQQADRLDQDGYNFSIQRDYRKALESFQKELPLRRTMHDTSGEAWSLNQIGESYSSLDECKSALDNYNQALPLFRRLKDLHGEARSLHGIASCQSRLGDKAAALENLKALLPLVHSTQDRGWEGTVMGDIGVTYLALGNNASAFDYLNKRLEFERAQGSSVGEADALESLGRAYQSVENKPKAIDSYRGALSILLKLSDTMTSDHLTVEIKQLKDTIAKLDR